MVFYMLSFWKITKKQQKVHQKSMQISSKKKSSQKWFKKCIWDGLGLHLGRFGGGLGRNLGSLGASWAVLGNLFVMLVIGVVFESVFEGIWTGFCSTLKGLRRISGGFGEVSGRVWKGFWSILAAFGLL